MTDKEKIEGKYYKVIDKDSPLFGFVCKVEGGNWHQGRLIGAVLKDPTDIGSISFLFNQIKEHRFWKIN